MLTDTVILELVKASLSVIGTIIGAIIVYQLIDFRKKQRLDTYWRVERMYKTDHNQEAREYIGEAVRDLENRENELKAKKINEESIESELISYYISDWHINEDKAIRDKARTIRYRIRRHHQYGVLLRKGMIDRDLLFSMIGLSFEIDYKVMKLVLKAYREYHEIPYMYNHFEYLWKQYIRWKKKSSLMK